MTDPHPLSRPPMSYISQGPYTCSFEWLDGEIQSYESHRLDSAIGMFWSTHPSLHDTGSCDRRVVFDIRGVTILGCLDHGIQDEDWVATHEVLNVIESLQLEGSARVDLFELRMSCMMAEEGS